MLCWPSNLCKAKELDDGSKSPSETVSGVKDKHNWGEERTSQRLGSPCYIHGIYYLCKYSSHLSTLYITAHVNLFLCEYSSHSYHFKYNIHSFQHCNGWTDFILFLLTG